jgi:predicted dehydrogenase
MTNTIRIGMIGLSEGNGHPYSWSTIINGDYDPKTMQDCGFPVIPEYLAANRDTLGIDGARVTHIWCQDRSVAEHVAMASHIENVVDRIEDFIGQVDAVILARDDPERHRPQAEPIIDAGLPIFIDKPLCYSRDDLEWFTTRQAEGKFVMSCSSLRYCPTVQGLRPGIGKLGELLLATTVGVKSWRTYGIHYLERMFSLLGDPICRRVRHVSEDEGSDVVYMEFDGGLRATAHVFQEIAPAITLDVFGREGHLAMPAPGSYRGFKTTLEEAVRSFHAGEPRLEFWRTFNVVSALIGARESLDAGGTTIELETPHAR